MIAFVEKLGKFFWLCVVLALVVLVGMWVLKRAERLPVAGPVIGAVTDKLQS